MTRLVERILSAQRSAPEADTAEFLSAVRKNV